MFRLCVTWYTSGFLFLCRYDTFLRVYCARVNLFKGKCGVVSFFLWFEGKLDAVTGSIC